MKQLLAMGYSEPLPPAASLMLYFAIVIGLLIVVVAAVIRSRNMQLWLPAYLRRKRPLVSPGTLKHLIFCVVDHYEPAWARPAYEIECERVRRWREGLAALAYRHKDGDGRPFRYTFFYPEEEYRPEHLDSLAELMRLGYAEVEVHLHHDGDTAENLRAKLQQFCTTLHERHGLLSKVDGEVGYAFIHGNWALDNSSPDGRWCGVTNELKVLRETGCYVDMTFPSAPHPTQPRKINSIYYAAGDPRRCKSHDRGRDVEVGVAPEGDLMLIQGPLGLNWRSRKFGLIPRIENGELSGDNPPSPSRADLWVREHVHVVGREEWVFVKLHTHGANEKNTPALLGDTMDGTLAYLETRYNDGREWKLHYATARETYNMVKAAEAGLTGDPGQYRDYVVTQGARSQSAV